MDTMTRIRDLHRSTPVADGGDRLVEVACRLRDEDVDGLIVMVGGQVIGVITDRELVEAVADGADLTRAIAAEFTTALVATVELDAGLDEAVQLLTETGARQLVVTAGGTPAFMIAARELLAAFQR